MDFAEYFPKKTHFKLNWGLRFLLSFGVCFFFSVKLHRVHFSKLIEEARKSMKNKAKGDSVSTGESETIPKEKKIGKQTGSTNESYNGQNVETVLNKLASVEKENSVITEVRSDVEDGGIVTQEVNEGYDDNQSSLQSSISAVKLKKTPSETSTERSLNKQFNSETVSASGPVSKEYPEKDNTPSRFTESSTILPENELSNDGSEELTSSPLFGSDTASPFKTQAFNPDKEKTLEPLKNGEVYATKDPVLPCVSSDTGDSSLAFEKESDANTENKVTEPRFDLLSSFDNFGNFSLTSSLQIV